MKQRYRCMGVQYTLKTKSLTAESAEVFFVNRAYGAINNNVVFSVPSVPLWLNLLI